MKQFIEQIRQNKDRRASLIALRRELKTTEGRLCFQKLTQGNYTFLMKCLVDGDAKVRKNAALILGELHCQDALDVLMDAYEAEEQLFVKADYVKAMGMLKCSAYLSRFHERLQQLEEQQPAENEKKHIQAEIREIRELLLKHEGVKRHTFCGYNRLSDMILMTDRGMGELTAKQIRNGKVKTLTAGVRVQTADLDEILAIRTYKEILFPLKTKDKCAFVLPADPKTAGQLLSDSDLYSILTETHSEPGPFYFRLSIVDGQPLDQRSIFSKKLAASIEEQSGGNLINSASHYEVELRLIRNKDGNYMPYLKLYTILDHRFAYRRYHVAASMRPNLAAELLELARPFLKEHAQVLDPFCGVGTMLVERNYLIPARDSYGLDIFGEAVEKARANAKIAKMNINYVNRDYFTFRHAYAFDEIITDMPVSAGEYQDLDDLYGRFFDKSAQVLGENGRIFLYSGEMGLVKKHLRLNGRYRLLQEFVVSEKSKTYFFILEKK